MMVCMIFMMVTKHQYSNHHCTIVYKFLLLMMVFMVFMIIPIGDFFWVPKYPLVMTNIAIENHHRNSEFSH